MTRAAYLIIALDVRDAEPFRQYEREILPVLQELHLIEVETAFGGYLSSCKRCCQDQCYNNGGKSFHNWSELYVNDFGLQGTNYSLGRYLDCLFFLVWPCIFVTGLP